MPSLLKAPSLEGRILSEIMRTGSLAEAINAGLKAEYFRNMESREIYQFLSNHWYHHSTRNELPLLESVTDRFPGFEIVDKTEQYHIRTLIRALRMRALDTDLRALAEMIMEVADEDPEEALQLVKMKAQAIDYNWSENQGFGLREIVSGARELYEGAKNGSLHGVPWPWPCLTQDTLGKKGGDLIVFYGRMKSMKTWLLLKCAADDYLKYNQRVLIWSKEMTEEKMKMRLASLLASVDYQLFKAGNLPLNIARRAFSELEALDRLTKLTKSSEEFEIDKLRNARDFLILCGRKAPKDVTSLAGVIKEQGPTVVYIDSFYHMSTARANDKAQIWHKITLLAEDLKELAMEFNIPVVIAAQANRLGEKYSGGLADVANADAIAREADLIMRVIKKKKNRPLPSKVMDEAPVQEVAEKEKKLKIRIAGILKSSPKNLEDDTMDAEDIDEEPSPEVADTTEKTEILRDDGAVPRVGAELVVVLGGNREGVLEAFSILAIPGYNFNVIDANFDIEEIQSWVTKDNEDIRKEMEHSEVSVGNKKPRTYKMNSFQKPK